MDEDAVCGQKRSGPGVVLVADPEPAGAALLRQALEDRGYRVRLAADGREALAQLGREPFRFAFVATRLPGVDGFRLVRHIREAAGGRFLPVVMVLEREAAGEATAAVDAGADDFLERPLGMPLVAAKLRVLERALALRSGFDRHQATLEREQEIARRIFATAMRPPDDRAAERVRCLTAPMSVLNGDLLLVSPTPTGGLNTLVGDFTGHGLAAAVGALPVAETFYAMSRKGFGPGEILPEINRKLDKADVQKLPPASLESFLSRMPQYQDAQALSQIAQALGVTPAPIPKSDVNLLFASAEVKATLKQRLTQANMNEAQLPEIEAFLKETVKAGASVYDVRQLIAVLHSNPQNRLQSFGTQRGVTSVPQLQASPAFLMQNVDNHLRQQFRTSTPELRAFIEQVATSRPSGQSLQFLASLRNNAIPQIAAEAKRMGVPVPKVDVDWALVDTTFGQTLNNQLIAYNAPLKKFAHHLVEHGVPVNTLNAVFGQLGVNLDLDQLMRNANIFVIGGPKVPTVQPDVDLISDRVQQQLARYGNFYDARRLKAFCKEVLQLGLPQQQVVNYAVNRAQFPRSHVVGQFPNIPPDKLPQLPIDEKALLGTIKARYGTQLTAAHETFIAKHLGAALQADDAYAYRFLQLGNVQQVLQAVEQWAGVTRPAGL